MKVAVYKRCLLLNQCTLIASMVFIAITIAGCTDVSETKPNNQTINHSSSIETKEHSRTKTDESQVATSNALPITLEEFLSNNKELKPAKSLGEFKQTKKFACDFAGGSGGVTGEYLKDSGRLTHLAFVGNGENWMNTVRRTIGLSVQDEAVAEEVISELALSETSAREASITRGDIKFSTAMTNGSNIFLMQNIGTLEMNTSDGDNSYVAPTVGISLEAFKSRFNKQIGKLAPNLRIRGPGEETTSAAYFCYNFTDDTILNIYANDRMMVETIELDGVPREATKFWKCAKALIATLDQRLTLSGSDQILAGLGHSSDNVLPKREYDCDRNGIHYLYSYSKYPPEGCALTIQSDQP